jgi:endonuclease/exonuclease/phosphatase family metal-dependent hydrolase
MTQRPFTRFFVPPALFLVVISGLVAETSPWPFPSRSAAPRLAPAVGNTLTVGFWNIEWFPGRGPTPSKADEMSQTSSVHLDMKNIQADIMGFEEVRDFASASLAVQPLAGFKVDVCANFPSREGQGHAQEVAIASRLQPVSAWAEQWKTGNGVTPPRGFAFAAYQLNPKQLALVYAVHLKSNRDGVSENVPTRQESIRQLRSHMDAMEKAYAGLGSLIWIVGGDFNTSMDDPEFAQEKTLRDLIAAGFAWGWQNAKPSERLTLPGRGGFHAASFDHIFFKGARLRQSKVINTSPQSSDHHAVVTTLEYPAIK